MLRAPPAPPNLWPTLFSQPIQSISIFKMQFKFLLLRKQPLPTRGFHGGSDGKEIARNAGDQGSIPGSGRSPGERNDNPAQYSSLKNSMNRGAWWATVYGITWGRLSVLLFCPDPCLSVVGLPFLGICYSYHLVVSTWRSGSLSWNPPAHRPPRLPPYWSRAERPIWLTGQKLGRTSYHKPYSGSSGIFLLAKPSLTQETK